MKSTKKTKIPFGAFKKHEIEVTGQGLTTERKLIRVGNSAGVTFPREIIDALGLVPGSWLKLSLDYKGRLTIAKSDVQERIEAYHQEIGKGVKARVQASRKK